MVSIPDLPKCDQPATARFEVWSPQNGHLHGSLDGIAYSCDEHAPEVVQAVHAAGLTPYSFRAGDPELNRTCGYLVDFGDPIPPAAGNSGPGGPLTPPAITHHIPEVAVPPVVVPLPAADRRHPRWCGRGRFCAEDQRHVSAVHTVNPAGAYLYVRAWLEQAHDPADAPVQLILEVTGDDGEPAEYRMELDQPRALAFVLRTLLRQAGVR